MADYTLRYFVSSGDGKRKNAGVWSARSFASDEEAIAGFQKDCATIRHNYRGYETIALTIFEGGRQVPFDL